MKGGKRKDKVNTSPSSSSSPPLHLFYSQDKLAAELNYFSESDRGRRGGEEKERKRASSALGYRRRLLSLKVEELKSGRFREKWEAII